MRSYETARRVFGFLEFLGWASVALGIIAAIILWSSVPSYAQTGAGIIAFFSGASVSLVGILFIAGVQVGRATVDSAEYGQQMLHIARENLVISKQNLKFQNQPATTFSSADLSDSKTTSKSFSQSDKKNSPDPDSIQKIQYQGKEITLENGKYLFDGKKFFSISKAEDYIDRHFSSEIKKAPIKQKKLS